MLIYEMLHVGILFDKNWELVIGKVESTYVWCGWNGKDDEWGSKGHKKGEKKEKEDVIVASTFGPISLNSLLDCLLPRQIYNNTSSTLILYFQSITHKKIYYFNIIKM